MTNHDVTMDLDELFGAPPARGEVMSFDDKAGQAAQSPASEPAASASAAAARDTVAAGDASGDAAERMSSRIGQLMRMLRDSMRELGLDKQVEQAAEVIPDARDRLKYIAAMTEQAAERALNATDLAKPIVTQLQKDATSLDKRWAAWYAAPQDIGESRALVTQTRDFLQSVPREAGAVNAQLMEIMLAQDFQDLTGQVIKKVMDMVYHIEQQLLAVLLENISPERRAGLIAIVAGTPNAEQVTSLLNGPQVNPDGRTDIVTDQTQVDDLLTELGF